MAREKSGKDRITKADRTRARLIEVATRLFQEHGSDEVTVRRIAAAAKIEAGSIYYHFSSRDQILRAVLERGVAALAADPVTARYARVLEVTHLRRATTQAAAAARLSLPFSTYRRHLRAGTEALADVLWECEIHGEMTASDPVAP